MNIPEHGLTRKYFYTQTNVIASVADVIFSIELQATTIRYHWRWIFPIIIHIQDPPNSKEKSKNIYLI